VIFFGASNDDFLWGVSPQDVVAFAASLVAHVLSPDLREEHWASLIANATKRSEAHIEDQRRSISEIAQCVSEHNGRLHFFHHFVVMDLGGKIDSRRWRLRDERGEAVVEAGGNFVDVYRALEEQASVVWFNDYIHLSSVGHARVARLISERVAQQKD